jgi:hypothetical protein
VAGPAYSFSWSAPPECPTEIEVAAEVAQLLESGPAPSARVAARAVVRHDADGQWHVELTTLRDGEEGSRALVAPSCRSLADATALIVALTIDPARAGRLGPANFGNPPGSSAPATPGEATAPGASATSSAPPAAITAATAAAATTRPRAAPEPAREASTVRRATETSNAHDARSATGPNEASWAVALAATGDVGRLAGPSLGGRLAGAWIAEPWRFEAYGFAWGLPTRVTAQSSSSLGADVEMFGGGVAACIRVLRASWIEVAPCLGPELGDVHGRGFGVETPQSQDRAWVAAAASVRAAMRISGPVFIAVEIGAVVALARDAFRLDGVVSASNPFQPTDETVYSPGAVQGRAALGVEVRLPR